MSDSRTAEVTCASCGHIGSHWENGPHPCCDCSCPRFIPLNLQKQQADDKELHDFAVTMALSKSRVLGTVMGMLRGAEQALESYSRAWNSYARDPDLKDLLEQIRKVSSLYDFGYSELLQTALGINTCEDGDPGDEQRMRFEDAGISSAEDDQDFDPDDLPWMDPIDMIRRKSGKEPFGTCQDESGCTNLAVFEDGSANVCSIHTTSDTPIHRGYDGGDDE